ncbi:MAG TPA: hypothetical protein DCR55_06590 [Lentisphaeria bacterium]|nr:hypothetical protein [Lentisphaeria bacterium]
MFSLRVSAYLALRYLSPRRSPVSWITLLLSVLGPMLGVALLIVVLAVMAGFNENIRAKILGVQAHLQLLPMNAAYIEDPEPVLLRLEELGLAAAPVVTGPVPIQLEETGVFDIKFIRGIDPEREPRVSQLENALDTGSLALREDELLIGRPTAYKLGLGIGDKLIIHAPAKLSRMVDLKRGEPTNDVPSEVYVPDELTVSGIFSLGMHDYDSSVIICHLERADDLFGYPWGAATAIQLNTEDPFKLREITQQLQQDPAFSGLSVLTWQQANRQLFDALQVEKNMMFFLLIPITVVAAFGIFTTLITVVVRKTREIGILKAIGTTPPTIWLIFVIQGTLVGLVGNVGGTILGLQIIKYRDDLAELLSRLWGVEIFPQELYKLSEIPAKVISADVTTILVSAQLICILASFFPAFYASFLRPADALHTGVE